MEPSSTGLPDDHWSEQTGVESRVVQVLAWIFGLMLLMTGIVTLTSTGNALLGSVKLGLLYLLTGLFVLPPVRNLLSRWTGIRLKGGIVVVIVFGVWLVLGMILMYGEVAQELGSNP